MKKAWWILPVIILGFLIFLFFFQQDTRKVGEKEIKEIKEGLEKKKEEIDSLMGEIGREDEERARLGEQEAKIDTLRIKEVEKMIRLPLDSSVLYFKEKLKEYEKKFNP